MTGQHNRSRWRWRFGSRTKSFLRKATRRERLLWRNCFAGPSSSNLTSQDVFYTWLKYLADRVEFDATARAKRQLVNLRIVDRDEMEGVNETLDAAALTYVAAFVASLGQLLHLVLMLTGNRRDD